MTERAFWGCVFNDSCNLFQGSVSDDDLQNVMKIANEIIGSELPVYRATVPLNLAKRIPEVVFMSDEVCVQIELEKI